MINMVFFYDILSLPLRPFIWEKQQNIIINKIKRTSELLPSHSRLNFGNVHLYPNYRSAGWTHRSEKFFSSRMGKITQNCRALDNISRKYLWVTKSKTIHPCQFSLRKKEISDIYFTSIIRKRQKNSFEIVESNLCISKQDKIPRAFVYEFYKNEANQKKYFLVCKIRLIYLSFILSYDLAT